MAGVGARGAVHQRAVGGREPQRVGFRPPGDRAEQAPDRTGFGLRGRLLVVRGGLCRRAGRGSGSAATGPRAKLCGSPAMSPDSATSPRRGERT